MRMPTSLLLVHSVGSDDGKSLQLGVVWRNHVRPLQWRNIVRELSAGAADRVPGAQLTHARHAQSDRQRTRDLPATCATPTQTCRQLSLPRSVSVEFPLTVIFLNIISVFREHIQCRCMLILIQLYSCGVQVMCSSVYFYGHHPHVSIRLRDHCISSQSPQHTYSMTYWWSGHPTFCGTNESRQ